MPLWVMMPLMGDDQATMGDDASMGDDQASMGDGQASIGDDQASMGDDMWMLPPGMASAACHVFPTTCASVHCKDGNTLLILIYLFICLLIKTLPVFLSLLVSS